MKDILNLGCVSKNWIHPCREYLRKNELQCYLVLDQVDGLQALDSLMQVLDAKILGHSHPFTGVHLKFSDPFDDFFKVGTGPYKRPQPVQPEPEEHQYFFPFESEGDFENDVYDEADYDEAHHDYTQDYESFDAWMYRKSEEAREKYQERAKLDRPLKRIFAKMDVKHVKVVANYGTKRVFQNKFKRFISLLPLHQITHFDTNLRISEFIGDLRPGQLSKLKELHIDGLMNALPSTLHQLFAVCPALEKWDSPIPGNMVGSFGAKKNLIKNIILYSFVKPKDFTDIRNANLSLTTLIANSSTCPIGKGSYDAIINLIEAQSATLQTIQMSEAFLKYCIQSHLTPIVTVRKIIAKCSKANRIKALNKFPNAGFIDRTK